METVDNNPILAYHAQIESGDLIVCKKIWRTYDHLVENVLHGYKDWFYSRDRAEHIIWFFEKFLRHSKGSLRGQFMNLELHQKAKFAAGFGFVGIDGLRQFHRIINIVGKKNGKSTESAGVGLYGLMADGEGGPEIFSVASKRDQAKLIWEEAKRMRNQSPSLRKRTRVTVSGIYYDDMDGKFEPLSSDKDTLDGLNVYFALMDEFHQWRNGKGLYNIIADGVSAREQPLIYMTSTAGTVRDDIYDELYDDCKRIIDGYSDPEGYRDDRTLPIIYELDKRDEYTDPTAWVKANPNLGVSKSYTYLSEKVELAKSNPKLVRNLLTKEFNIPEVEETTWLDWHELDNQSTYQFTADGLIVTIKDHDGKVLDKYSRPMPDYVVGGFDLSVRNDLTSACVVWQYPNDDNLYVMPMFWTPADLVEDHEKSDGFDYRKYEERGLMEFSPGNQVDYKQVNHWFKKLYDDLDMYYYRIGYDPAYAGYLVDQLKETFGDVVPEVVRQGAYTQGMPMATIEKKFKAGQVIYNNNPIFKWNLMCVKVVEDRNGNIMPTKVRKHNERIDGFAAMLDAWTVLLRYHDEYLAMQGG